MKAVSVKDRLPEDSGEVVVKFRYPYSQSCWAIGQYVESEDWWVVRTNELSVEVTHWCPLPEVEESRDG